MVDEAVVVDHLRAVNEYTNDLKEMRGLSKEAYLDDVVIQNRREATAAFTRCYPAPPSGVRGPSSLREIQNVSGDNHIDKSILTN